MLKVKKRDGRIVAFNEQKIINAIENAFMSVDKDIFCWYTLNWANESYALTIKYMA